MYFKSILLHSKLSCIPCLGFCVILLTLSPVSLAADNFVLFSEDEKQLQVDYVSNEVYLQILNIYNIFILSFVLVTI